MQTIFDLLFIFVASLTPLLWFSGNKVLTGHDSGFPLNPLVHFLDRLFLWTNRFGFGSNQSMQSGAFFIHGQEALLQFLGFSLQSEQKIIFISWFFLVGLSGYILGRVLFGYEKHRLLALISSFFLMFNSYTLQPWPLAERANFSVIIATAFFISFVCLYFKNRITFVQAGILAAFSLFFFNGGGANGLPLYGGFFVAFIWSLLFFTLAYCQTNAKTLWSAAIKKVLPFLAVFGISLFLLDAFWFLPLWHYARFNLSLRVGAQGNIEGLLAWLHMVNANSSILNLFRLQGEAGWYGANTSHPFGPLYLNNTFLILGSFFWPLLAFLAVFLSGKEDKPKIIFLLLLALAGIFFTAGSYPPTGYLFEQMFRHIPGFLVFRSAWNKFNYIISIPYAVLIGYTIDKIYLTGREKLKRVKWLPYSFVAVFFLILGAYNFPYFGTKMFVWNKPLTLMVDIPQYINDFGQWSESLPPDTRFLVLPPVNQQWSGAAYDWGYFSSTPPVSVLTSRATFSNFSYLSGNQLEIMDKLDKDLLNQNYQEARIILNLLKINYVLLEKDTLPDLSWIKTIPPKDYAKNLAQISWLTPFKTFGKWEIYQVNNKKASSLFSLFNNFIFTNLPAGELIKWMARSQSPQNAIYLTYSNINNSSFQPQNYLWQTQCLNCLMPKMDYFLPQTRFLPGTRFYDFLVVKKEQKILANESNLNRNQKIDLYLGLSLKRLAEADKLSEAKKYQETVIVLNEYINMINKIYSFLPAGNQSDMSIIDTQKRLYNYSSFAREKLKFFQDRGIKDGNIIKLIETADDRLALLKKSILEDPTWSENAWHKFYTFNIPKDGEYQVEYLNPAKNGVQIKVDNKPAETDKAITLAPGIHEMEISTAPDIVLPVDLEPVLISPFAKNTAEIPGINWQRIDQTEYLASSKNISSDFWLEFKDSYNDNWQLYADDKPVPSEQHFESNGFGNAWLVKANDLNKTETHSFALSFIPQKLFEISGLISLATLAVLIIVLILSFTLK